MHEAASFQSCGLRQRTYSPGLRNSSDVCLFLLLATEAVGEEPTHGGLFEFAGGGDELFLDFDGALDFPKDGSDFFLFRLWRVRDYLAS